jgi:transcriptional regulator with XRE-family HTH domain
MRSGLSQREIGEILGFFSDVPVSRHETGAGIPDLRTALGYEVIFRMPISAQFSTLLSMIEPLVEGRLAELERKLEQQTPRGHNADRIARKLEFLAMRRDIDFHEE